MRKKKFYMCLIIVLVMIVSILFGVYVLSSRQHESLRLPSTDPSSLMERCLARLPEKERITQWKIMDNYDYNPYVSFFRVRVELAPFSQVVVLSFVVYPSQKIMILDDYDGGPPIWDSVRFIMY